MGDHWRDPLSELERMQQEVEEHELARVDRESASIQYENLWKGVQEQTRTDDAALSLGWELHRRGDDFWIRLWLLILKRGYEVSGRHRASDELLRLEAVLKLLLSACQDDRDSVRTTINRMHSVAVPFVWDSTFTEAKIWIALWGNGHESPYTPHMTRQELIAATAEISGMSEPSVCRKLKNRVILIDEPKQHMARFKHSDPAVHLEILRASLQFLTNL